MQPRIFMRFLLALIALLLAVMLGAAALPALVRALPGRYAYYLPEPLQALRRVPHAATLPAPVVTPFPTVTPLPTPTPTVTPPPEAPPLPTVTHTPAPTATPAPPAAATLTGIRHEAQGWNNCGPTTLAMALSYWGRAETQRDLAPALKPDKEDKNVSPEELAAATQAVGLEALVRVGGDLALLKRLLVSGYPVIVETWEVRSPDDQLGHYRLLTGYDDAAGQFLTYDSLDGPDLPVAYADLDELWRVFNRVYVLVYPPERAGEVAAALGPAWDATWAWEHARAVAQIEAAAPAADCVAYAACADGATFAWFNVGSSLVALNRHAEAAAAFDQARTAGLPWRMLWYQFGPYAAYDAVGRYDDVIALADATLRVTPNLEESYNWRGRARLALGDVAGARADFEAALRYHPDWPPALAALATLPTE